MVERVAETLRRGMEEGEIREVDPRAAATFLWGSWNGVIALNLRGVLDEKGLRTSIAVGREMLLDGLRT
jgi:TetR/AcrR family transcriptional regulator